MAATDNTQLLSATTVNSKNELWSGLLTVPKSTVNEMKMSRAGWLEKYI
jgi:hypothetical protein